MGTDLLPWFHLRTEWPSCHKLTLGNSLVTHQTIYDSPTKVNVANPYLFSSTPRTICNIKQVKHVRVTACGLGLQKNVDSKYDNSILPCKIFIYGKDETFILTQTSTPDDVQTACHLTFNSPAN